MFEHQAYRGWIFFIKRERQRNLSKYFIQPKPCRYRIHRLMSHTIATTWNEKHQVFIQLIHNDTNEHALLDVLWMHSAVSVRKAIERKRQRDIWVSNACAQILCQVLSIMYWLWMNYIRCLNTVPIHLLICLYVHKS